MTALAPTVEAFFTQRLAVQRDASPHTVASYRDTLRLLLVFAHHRTGTPPSRLDVGDIDATLVCGVPHPSGNRARQQRVHPQRPAHRHPLAIPLRGVIRNF
jgi:integrase/recombinase XerD